MGDLFVKKMHTDEAKPRTRLNLIVPVTIQKPTTFTLRHVNTHKDNLRISQMCYIPVNLVPHTKKDIRETRGWMSSMRVAGYSFVEEPILDYAKCCLYYSSILGKGGD